MAERTYKEGLVDNLKGLVIGNLLFSDYPRLLVQGHSKDSIFIEFEGSRFELRIFRIKEVNINQYMKIKITIEEEDEFKG